MTVKEKIPVWLDCDPGTDDAFAILLILRNPRFNVIGMSSVHGNAPLKFTTHNILVIMDELKKYDFPVYEGSERPLINPPQNAANIHGLNGLGDVPNPKITISQLKHDKLYLEAIRDAAYAHSEKLLLLATGTLTNLSHLLTAYPDIVDHVRYLSIMGGSFGFGNVTPYAEFNFFVDPHATRHVVREFASKILLAPLNVTHTVLANDQVRSEVGLHLKFFEQLLDFSNKTNPDGTDGPPVHDPVAVFIALGAIDEEDYHDGVEYGLEWKEVSLDIVIDGDHAGEVVVGQGPKSKVFSKVNVQLLWSMVNEALTLNV